MTPQQAREKIREYLQEQDELTAAIGRTSVRFVVTHRLIEQIKRFYGELMSPLEAIALSDNGEECHAWDATNDNQDAYY